MLKKLVVTMLVVLAVVGVVLPIMAQSSTKQLVYGYVTPGPDTWYKKDVNSFLVVSTEQTFDAANDLLFNQGAAGCLPVDAPRDAVERVIREAVERREMEKLDAADDDDATSHKCPFAAAYRNGYYCLKHDNCPYGAFQGGWISIEGREHLKCAKRPLLVDSFAHVGFTAWTGSVSPQDAMELRTQLLRLIRAPKKEIVIDAQGLTDAHYNLFEVLSDACAELLERTPDGLIHVINLSAAMQDSFRKAVSHKAVRFYGYRMVDERSTFKRWGSRFS